MNRFILILTGILLTTEGTRAQNNDNVCTGTIKIIDFSIGSIPLFSQHRHPVDVLIFEQQEIDGYSVYVVQSKHGDKLKPHTLIHGAQSAAIMKENKKLEDQNIDFWTRTHIFPKPPHVLSFAVFGEVNDWIKIEINSDTHEVCHIKYIPEYMHYTSWEDTIVNKTLFFTDALTYDAANGNEISIKSELKNGWVEKIEGEWIRVGYEDSGTKTCWVKWRDSKGFLPAVMFYEAIY